MNFNINVQFSISFINNNNVVTHEVVRGVNSLTDVEPTILDILKTHRDSVLCYRNLINSITSPKFMNFTDINEDDCVVYVTLTDNVNTNNEIIGFFF